MYPEDLKYTDKHEWVRTGNGSTVRVGITSFAADALGDVVFVDLPAVGATFAQGDVAGVVESVKAAADVYMPVSGEVVEVNEALRDDPSLANSDPMNAGWFFKVKLSAPAELDALIGQGAPLDALRRHAQLQGFSPLADAARALALSGRTSLDEALRVVDLPPHRADED